MENIFNDVLIPFGEDPFRTMNRVMNTMLAPLAAVPTIMGPSLLPTLMPSIRDLDQETNRIMNRVGLRSMDLDILEKADHYEIHCELPGVGKNHVKVEVDTETNTLTVKAEKKITNRSPKIGGNKTDTKNVSNQPTMSLSDASSSATSEPAESLSSSTPTSSEHNHTGSNDTATNTSSVSTSSVDKPVPEDTSKVHHYHRSERIFGSISRTITFPTDVDVDAVTAKMDHGVLTIILPKRKIMTNQSTKSINIE